MRCMPPPPSGAERPELTELTELTATLRRAGCVFAEAEADLLLAETHGDPDGRRLARLSAQRVSGLPLEQVLGWASFDGLRVAVRPGVFVPRTRSLLLVRLAVAHLAGTLGEGASEAGVVLDLCCGTGALGAAVLARRPATEVHASDLDPAAVRCARRNLPAERVHSGDLYDALPGHLRGRVDVLVVNAPYVPTGAIASMPAEAREHEHRLALDGGEDGLDVQRRVVAAARSWLVPDGALLVETGHTQAPDTAVLMTAAGLRATTHLDPEVLGCVVAGTAPALV